MKAKRSNEQAGTQNQSTNPTKEATIKLAEKEMNLKFGNCLELSGMNMGNLPR